MDGKGFKTLNLSQLEVLPSEIVKYEALIAHEQFRKNLESP